MENIPFSPNEILDKTLSLSSNLYYSLLAPPPQRVTTNLTLMDLSSIVTSRKQVLVDLTETVQAHGLRASLFAMVLS